MELEAKIARAKELIGKREALDAEIAELLAGGVREKRTLRCSICGEAGHRARTCPSRVTEQTPQ